MPAAPLIRQEGCTCANAASGWLSSRLSENLDLWPDGVYLQSRGELTVLRIICPPIPNKPCFAAHIELAGLSSFS
jgi:hypothetical protein